MRLTTARRALNLGQFLPVGPSHESTFLPSVFPAFASTEFTSSQEPFTDSLPEASRKSSDISLLDTTVHSTKEIAENLLSPTLKVSTTISRSKGELTLVGFSYTHAQTINLRPMSCSTNLSLLACWPFKQRSLYLI